MITSADLEVKRTPEELKEFVSSTFDSIRADNATKKVARQRKPPFKELIEEVYPLSIFCNIKYQGASVQCCPVIGSQGYDAKIETPSGELIEKIELTWPIDGQKAHSQALQLNKKGHTNVEVRDVNNNSDREQIIERVLQTANNKALKDYDSPEGSSLVFVLDISPYFGMHTIEHQKDINNLQQQLKEIEYKVQSVYLLLLPINDLVQIK